MLKAIVRPDQAKNILGLADVEANKVYFLSSTELELQPSPKFEIEGIKYSCIDPETIPLHKQIVFPGIHPKSHPNALNLNILVDRNQNSS